MKEIELDLTGMRCPAPIVRLNSAVKELAAGDVLRVLASDPAFEMDARAWCRRTGHELLSLDGATGAYRARIAKRA